MPSNSRKNKYFRDTDTLPLIQEKLKDMFSKNSLKNDMHSMSTIITSIPPNDPVVDAWEYKIITNIREILVPSGPFLLMLTKF